MNQTIKVLTKHVDPSRPAGGVTFQLRVFTGAAHGRQLRTEREVHHTAAPRARPVLPHTVINGRPPQPGAAQRDRPPGAAHGQTQHTHTTHAHRPPRRQARRVAHTDITTGTTAPYRRAHTHTNTADVKRLSKIHDSHTRTRRRARDRYGWERDASDKRESRVCCERQEARFRARDGDLRSGAIRSGTNMKASDGGSWRSSGLRAGGRTGLHGRSLVVTLRYVI